MTSSDPFQLPIPCFNLDSTDLARLSDPAQVILKKVTFPVDSPPESLFLTSYQQALALADGSDKRQKPVYVDFFSAKARHRQRFGGGRSQAIAKAVGLNRKTPLSVLDATAGLGQDAWVLASLGAEVIMLERHPVVRLLLEDGLCRAKDQGLTSNALALLEGNLIEGVELARAPDVIYLDPMFPVRRSSAAVKKEMALFHPLVGADSDADALLSPALKLATHRVVVKRPRIAPYLDKRKPSLELTGKSSRFDVYTLKAFELP